MGTFVVRSANCSLEIEELAVSKKQRTIQCIPKGDKDRQELTKSRPLSLLNVSYKIIFICIAERMKKILSKIIHMDQTGFFVCPLHRREHQSFVDIMHMAEQREMPGFFALNRF